MESVQIDSSNLSARWQGQKLFTIMETRFDSGRRFLAAWHAWQSDDPSQRCERLHVVSIESQPANWRFAIEKLDMAEVSSAPAFDALARELATQWPLAVRGVHRLEFAQGRVVLTLAFDALDASLAALWLRADAFHLNDPDAVAQGRIGTAELSKGIARLAGESATVACEDLTDALGVSLKSTGFVFDDLDSADSRAFMPSLTRGHFAPKWRVRRHDPPLPEPSINTGHLKGQQTGEPHQSPAAPVYSGSRTYSDAMIIGAGLAGCALAERLAERGLDLALIDTAAGPATRASGNPAGVFHPVISADDSLAARATRAGFLYALRRWQALDAQGFKFDWRADGLVQVATTAEEEAAYRDALSTLGFPDELVRYVSADDAYAILGVKPAHGGLYFSRGGMLDPASLCHAQLAAASSRTTLTRHFNRAVATLVHSDGLWHAMDSTGNRLASAPVAIVANAADASRLASLEHAPVRSIRGQLTWLDPSPVAALRHPLIGDGYVLPDSAHRGRQLIGASYELDDPDEHLREDSQQDNLDRLSRLIPAVAQTLRAQAADRAMAGRVAFRCVTSDRMPMIGQLADEETARQQAGRLSGAWPLDLPRKGGLYGAYGYGSRGLTWAALGAEIIASQILGEPLPVTRDIADGFDPARFLQRALRQRAVH
ncbi:FAD-dependent 5-carboxymethylaminomethyl-2-thiouridine(34) oxidoreductase MnmC [Pararobbsia alpina]|uniref:tRNA 5-methylaminomethyl-2-thiouridine biosynthesis bifunctional protein MnmC n=1 Tax=Pararobbsia alpina TaxID=621374 RepID=A0A6S7C1H7_9BURK|nr:FAD-dependent 5-carboxymethylaminomethyl-2-thiouridine(34) oxidoreductase MnmC [Pararobbsia alpina]CAB3778853.1 tRNA 5-methylaminomethyl-2-thiouridine biosynthesis bifunctional protein MnmC [Pararobbsia alpina]